MEWVPAGPETATGTWSAPYSLLPTPHGLLPPFPLMSDHHAEYVAAAKLIDHALLTPVQTDADMEAGCRLAAAYDVAGVCIKPTWIAFAARRLSDTAGRVMVQTVIGFPHGANHTAVKVAEARQALADGAVELDMVVNIGKVLSGDWNYVADDIARVAEAAFEREACIKVIFENCYLQDAHKRDLCRICAEVGVHFVKTSTGFGTGGATDEDVRLMRECSPPPMQVKASGGVRTLERMRAVQALGATRVGTSSTAAILDELRKQLGLPPIHVPGTTAPGGTY